MVFFAVPAYGANVSTAFAHSLIDTFGVLESAQVPATVVYHCKDAYLGRARNSLAHLFLKSDATDLFFIDADMGWDAKAPLRMLARPYEFVGGAYSFKQDEEDYPVTVHSDPHGRPLVDPGTGCISATMLPSGFWRLRRSVLEKMAPACEWYWDKGEKVLNFFDTPVVEHEWIGEDVWFCRRWLKLGGQIWLEPNIDFIHSGVKDWKGNYHEFLLRQPGGSKHGTLCQQQPILA